MRFGVDIRFAKTSDVSRANVDAVLIVGSTMLFAHRRKISELAKEHRLPRDLEHQRICRRWRAIGGWPGRRIHIPPSVDVHSPYLERRIAGRPAIRAIDQAEVGRESSDGSWTGRRYSAVRLAACESTAP